MRNGLASEYEAAPLVRLVCQTFEIDADGGEEITSLIPYKALIDGAPFVHIRLSYVIDDPNNGPCIIIGTAVVNPGQCAYQRLNRAAGFAVVRVRKVLPREISTSTTLIDGNKVFIGNRDDQNVYACQLIIEAPSLNWTP